MKRTNTKAIINNLGYTIVEVMIVLAVTGVMFTSVVVLVSGKQRTTEFQAAVNELKTSIQQVATEVSNGYFAKPNDKGCAIGVNGPEITNNTSDQGNCVFIGKILHFYSSGTPEFAVYTVIGNRSDVGTYEAAKPFVVAPGLNATFLARTSSTDLTTTKPVRYGIQPRRLSFIPPTGAGSSRGSFGFFQSLNNAGSDVSGGSSQFMKIVGFTSISASSLGNNAANEADALNNSLALPEGIEYRVGGNVEICFNSGGTNQRAIIKIGSSNSNFDVTSQISSGACA